MDGATLRENSQQNVRRQMVGGIVNEQNRQNLEKLMQQLHKIDKLDSATKARIQRNLKKALECVDNVRDFVGDPEHILGSQKTKHGEIAEKVDVNFHNADRIMHNKKPNATDAPDKVGRTAPEDYYVNDIMVQSKYINGSNNSLSHVIDHMKKYENYDGMNFAKDGYYVIPKDQYEQIMRVKHGKTDGLNKRSVDAIDKKIKEIEERSGKSFSEAVRPGNVDYAAVQQGKICETLDDKTDQLNQTAKGQKQRADERSEKKRDAAQQEAAPSWQKAGKATASAAAFAGVSQLAVGIYTKCASGKKISEFTAEDWKEIGIDTAKATAEGGVSGLAIYGLTNLAGTSSPTAAAGVSLAFTLTDLVYQLSCGEMSQEEFNKRCQTVAVNTALSAVGAMVGQQLIPIPVLGAYIGSFVATKGYELLCTDGIYDAELIVRLHKINEKLDEHLQQLRKVDYAAYKKEITHLNAIRPLLAESNQELNEIYAKLDEMGVNMQFHSSEEFDEKMMDDEFVLEL